MPFRMRPSAAILCIAIAVFTTVVSAIDFVAPALLVIAAWQLVPVTSVAIVRRDDRRRDEQTSSLLELLLSRPPPHTIALA